MEELEYKFVRTIKGKILKYRCPHCAEPLESGLAEAGTQDACPECGGRFTVPGLLQRQREQQSQAKKLAEVAANHRAKQAGNMLANLKSAASDFVQARAEEASERSKRRDTRLAANLAAEKKANAPTFENMHRELRTLRIAFQAQRSATRIAGALLMFGAFWAVALTGSDLVWLAFVAGLVMLIRG